MAENMVTTTSWNRDNLIAGQLSPITERITVASGQNIVRGTLLGKITRAVSTVVPGTNTGNGTISAFTMGKKTAIGSYVVECISQTKGKSAGTPVAGTNTGNGVMGATTLGSAAQVGTYKLTCIEKVTDKGTFKVLTPHEERLDDAVAGTAYVSDHINFTIADGTIDFEVGDEFTVVVSETDSNVGTFKVLTPSKERLDDAVVGTAYVSDHINFTIADGSVDFAVGDKFTLPVIAGSGYRNKSLLAAVDGSEVPESIAIAAVDATLATKTSNAYVYGQFNQASMAFGTGHTFANTRDALRKTGIFLTEVSTQN